MEITINCDDEYILWVNHEYIGENQQWDVAQNYSVPLISGKNVVAVHSVNTGYPGSLIVEVKVDGNDVLVTNETWRRYGTEVAGWQEINFDDAGWLTSVDYGLYGVAPWEKNIANFPDNSNAHWIWGEIFKEDYREWYFRGSFQYGLSKPAAENFENEEEISRIITLDAYKLENAYPNPFNSETIIKYHIPKDGFVDISIYDVTGREIKTLVNEYKDQGIYLCRWNGTDQFGQFVVSGVYLYKITTNSFTQTKKLILIK
jgi:hypothetical protein